jgi:hypothetical protein
VAKNKQIDYLLLSDPFFDACQKVEIERRGISVKRISAANIRISTPSNPNPHKLPITPPSGRFRFVKLSRAGELSSQMRSGSARFRFLEEARLRKSGKRKCETIVAGGVWND